MVFGPKSLTKSGVYCIYKDSQWTFIHSFLAFLLSSKTIYKPLPKNFIAISYYGNPAKWIKYDMSKPLVWDYNFAQVLYRLQSLPCRVWNQKSWPWLVSTPSDKGMLTRPSWTTNPLKKSTGKIHLFLVPKVSFQY